MGQCYTVSQKTRERWIKKSGKGVPAGRYSQRDRGYGTGCFALVIVSVSSVLSAVRAECGNLWNFESRNSYETSKVQMVRATAGVFPPMQQWSEQLVTCSKGSRSSVVEFSPKIVGSTMVKRFEIM
ncbi:hypothetical protein R1flu_028396 [Riccia fluitans]|uniref:Uncharacterized protein n=1 Tax=Riccia fluitans TaxID=41844 RepID=A0ABD1XQL0_9MARC